MHTLPAAKIVGHDFLGNHIGELLFRQPASRPPPPSSNGSTICQSDIKSVRRGSTTAQHASLFAPSKSKLAETQRGLPTLDVAASFGASADTVASLDQSSESSPSEPSSVYSRSGSADYDLPLHLDQLSLSRKRVASEGGPVSPRVSFVTNFGAKSRHSGRRRAPSEAGSSSYFGLSSNLSSASMSPMELSGSVNGNVPFREQHHSFAKAIEQNAVPVRKPSQQDQCSKAASSGLQPPPPSASQSGPDAEITTPTASVGSAVSDTKSKSFSRSSQPVRKRLTRAATESTLDPVAQLQAQQPPASPTGPSEHSSIALTHSKSMGAAQSEVRGHRRMPSLVPKGDDQRTFCFVNDESSESGPGHVLAENVKGPDSTLLSSVPEASAPPTMSKSMSKSSSRSSYKDIVEVQYSAPRCGIPAATGVINGHSPPSTAESAASDKSKPNAALEMTTTSSKIYSNTIRSPQSVVRGQDTQQSAVNVAPMVASLSRQSSSSRPVRRLRIQPNVQSRPSLLERTMEQQRKASHAAIAANTNGSLSESTVPATTTPNVGEGPAQTPGSMAIIDERYNPVAYDAGQRTFRIHSTPPPTDGDVFPLAVISSDDGGKRSEPANHTRTSDWARAQNLLTGPQPAQGQADGGCMSTLDNHVMAMEQHRPASQTLLRHHTASHSSESTDSPSLLDTRETLSPPETAISTPELESPLEEALLDADNFKLNPTSRRPSPLSS